MGHQKALAPSRRYTMEFKVESVRLAESVGCSEASRRQPRGPLRRHET